MICYLFALLLFACAGFFHFIYVVPAQWVGEEGANLIGETLINKKTAVAFANSMLGEVDDIWTQPDEAWHTYSDTGNLVIQSRRVSHGPFNTSGVLLTRGKAFLSSKSAKEIYEFLVSPEGFALIDPMSKTKEYSDYAERFAYKKGRLEVAHAFAYAAASSVQFCVLNAYVNSELTFISKSIQHKSCPGTSEYGEFPEEAQTPRALNTFAIRTSDTRDGKVLLEMINYQDMPGLPLPTNFINVAVFLQGLVQRLEESIAPTTMGNVWKTP